MPNKDTLILARPGDVAAARAVAALHRRRKSDTTIPAALMCVFLPLFMTLMKDADETGQAVLMILMAGLTAFALYASYHAVRDMLELPRRNYRKLVNSGDIIEVDPHMIAVWDELRAEEDLRLTAEERHQRLHGLFYAAEDLRETLRTRHAYLDEPEMADDLLLTEARIRARLLREVRTVREEIETRRLIDQLNPALEPSWVSASEVGEQLDLLRKRQDQDTDASDTEQPDAAGQEQDATSVKEAGR